MTSLALQTSAQVEAEAPLFPAPEPSLGELESRIRVAHDRTEEARRGVGLAAVEMLRRGLEAGRLLTEARALLPAGTSFNRWVEESLPFAGRTARLYVQLHEHRETIERMLEDPERAASASIRSALEEIRGHDTLPSGDDTDDTPPPPKLPSPAKLVGRLFKPIDPSHPETADLIAGLATRFRDRCADPATAARQVSALFEQVAQLTESDDESRQDDGERPARRRSVRRKRPMKFKGSGRRAAT